MYYTIYEITNLVNGKSYIGAHQTEVVDDGYMGSGYLIRYAIKKYGLNSFSKEILFFLDSKEEMFAKERELVTEDFVKLKTNYNIMTGGKGGAHSQYNNPEYRASQSIKKKQWIEQHPESLIDWVNISDQGRRTISLLNATDQEYRERNNNHLANIRSLTLTETARIKKQTKYKQIGHQQGEKNSQYGKHWIYNLTTLENQLVKKDIPIPEGWIRGRISPRKKMND